jgi:hypothetical protein
VVTSLEDSGPGTFREACEAGGPRIVVFNVAGIIRLKDRVRIRAPYITIAGQTAPGDGVCIAGANVALDTHDVVIRHMRFRRGETNVGDRDDSIGGNPIGNIMIDHVSASWGLDENMSMYRHMYDHDGNRQTPDLKLPTVNITIQNSIFSEGLNTYNHAFGSTIGGHNSTFQRNLWACNSGRNPSVGWTAISRSSTTCCSTGGTGRWTAGITGADTTSLTIILSQGRRRRGVMSAIESSSRVGAQQDGGGSFRQGVCGWECRGGE